MFRNRGRFLLWPLHPTTAGHLHLQSNAEPPHLEGSQPPRLEGFFPLPKAYAMGCKGFPPFQKPILLWGVCYCNSCRVYLCRCPVGSLWGWHQQWGNEVTVCSLKTRPHLLSVLLFNVIQHTVDNICDPRLKRHRQNGQRVYCC